MVRRVYENQLLDDCEKRIHARKKHRNVRDTAHCLRFEQLEPRLVLSTISEFAGLKLVDPNGENLAGQIVHLKFDGANDVTYNGPVKVTQLEVPRFKAPDALLGQEHAIISEAVDRLNDVFAGVGVVITQERPDSNIPHSTVYVGGDDRAFDEFGHFLGLAEQIDVANRDRSDVALVFSDLIAPDAVSVAAYMGDFVKVLEHEVGHLLGFAHVRGSDILNQTIGDVAFVGRGGPTVQFQEPELNGITITLVGVVEDISSTATFRDFQLRYRERGPGDQDFSAFKLCRSAKASRGFWSSRIHAAHDRW